MSETRTIKAAPFCWQHKPALRKIREAFDAEKTVASAIVVYVALTEIASDEKSEEFQTTHAWISQKSGVSPRTVQDRLTGLAEIGLVVISTPALKTPSTYRLLNVTDAPRDKQPLPNAPQREKQSALPTLEQGKKKALNKGKELPPPRKREMWQLLRDEKEIQKRISDEREKVKPDKELIESLRGESRQVKDEIRGLPGQKSKESL